VSGQRHAPVVPYPGKDPVPFVQEAGWASGQVWTDVENLAPTRIRSPDRPARRQSLYRLSYPIHYFILSEKTNLQYTLLHTSFIDRRLKWIV